MSASSAMIVKREASVGTVDTVIMPRHVYSGMPSILVTFMVTIIEAWNVGLGLGYTRTGLVTPEPMGPVYAGQARAMQREMRDREVNTFVCSMSIHTYNIEYILIEI